jgi:hypothetical protein
MAFCSEMGDNVQSRMVAKFYQFLRDFAPEGLTGRFSHISGKGGHGVPVISRQAEHKVAA